MITAKISSRGQITIPADVRRKLGLEPHSKVWIEVRDKEIVISRARSVQEVGGSLSEYAQGKSTDWETIRRETERAIAEEVLGKDRDQPRRPHSS